jgi:hypothetical protein
MRANFNQIIPNCVGEMANQGPLAVRTAVRSLRIAQDDGLDRALWREADAQAQVLSAVFCLLPSVCCLLSGVCRLLSAICCLLRIAQDDGLDRALWREADAQAQVMFIMFFSSNSLPFAVCFDSFARCGKTQNW